jgi:hypothetical protein
MDIPSLHGMGLLQCKLVLELADLSIDVSFSFVIDRLHLRIRNNLALSLAY